MDEMSEFRQTAEQMLAGVLPGPIEEAGIIIFGLYETMRNGGFSEFQALWICGYVASSGSTSGFEQEETS